MALKTELLSVLVFVAWMACSRVSYRIQCAYYSRYKLRWTVEDYRITVLLSALFGPLALLATWLVYPSEKAEKRFSRHD